MEWDEAEEAPTPEYPGPRMHRALAGRARFAAFDRRRLAWLLAALVALLWLPVGSPTDGRASAQMAWAPIGSQGWRLAVAVGASRIASSHVDGSVRLCDPTDGSVQLLVDDRRHSPTIALSPDGRSLAIGGDIAEVELYDLGLGDARLRRVIPICETTELRFSPDGRILAAALARSNDVILWDVEAGHEWKALRGHTSPVSSLAFFPDGRSLATGGRADRTILVWDLESGRPTRTFRGSDAPLVSLAASADGRLLVSSNPNECRVRVRDVATGAQVRSLAGQSPWPDLVAFGLDRSMAAVADDRGVVRLWSLETGRELGRLDGQCAQLRGLAISPDGQSLLALGADGGILSWDLADLTADAGIHRTIASIPVR
ncbi:MAG: WD40 repeat domain-containing protein [Isosphaeraceae bacterium]